MRVIAAAVRTGFGDLSAAAVGPVGLGHATPNAVGLTDDQGVLTTARAYPALPTQLLCLPFPGGPGPMPVRRRGRRTARWCRYSGRRRGAASSSRRGTGWCEGVGRSCILSGARVPGCPGVRAVGAPTEAETWCARRSLDATHTTAPAVDASGSPQRISGRSGAGGSRREGHAGAPTPGLEFGGKATSSRRGGRSTLLGFASASLGTGVRGTETWSHDSDTMVGFSRPEAYSFPVTPAELVESLPAWVTRGREEKDDLGSDLAVEIGWQTGHEVGS